MEEVLLGKIVATLGLKGELKVYSNTDFASIRYKKNNEVILVNPINNKREVLKIASFKKYKNMDVISFVGLEDINLVEKYINYEIRIEKPTEKLDSNIFYYADLIDCKVINEDKEIGVVSEIIDTGRQYILRIKREKKKDLLYPFVEHFFKNIDIENKVVELNPIEGMLEND